MKHNWITLIIDEVIQVMQTFFCNYTKKLEVEQLSIVLNLNF